MQKQHTQHMQRYTYIADIHTRQRQIKYCSSYIPQSNEKEVTIYANIVTFNIDSQPVTFNTGVSNDSTSFAPEVREQPHTYLGRYFYAF